MPSARARRVLDGIAPQRRTIIDLSAAEPVTDDVLEALVALSCRAHLAGGSVELLAPTPEVVLRLHDLA